MFHLNQGCYDVDSPAFDAKVYYEQLITTASLPTLLKRENELMSGLSLALCVYALSDLDGCRGKTTG